MSLCRFCRAPLTRTFLERGMNVFEAARRTAQNKGWPFNWRLVKADGIGHAGGQMMRSPEMLNAITSGK